MPPASELNGSPSLSRSPSRPLFGFGEPREETGDLLQSDLPRPASPSPEESLEALEPASADEWDDESDLEDLESTSSRASTPAGDVGGVLDSEGLRDMFRGGIIIAGDQAHNLLAKSEGQRAVGLYATDQEDAERIGDPLARLAGRHQGIGAMSDDTQDLLAAMVGLTRYATKQVQRGQAARKWDAGHAPAATEPADV